MRRSSERGRRLPLVLRREQFEELVAAGARDRGAAVIATRDAAILAVLLFAGIRNAELVALDLPDVAEHDPQYGWTPTGIVHVRRGKGDKERHSPLADAGLRPLEAWLDVRPECVLLDGSEPVFVSRKGGRLTTKALRDLVKAAGLRAGHGGRLHPHALRHANATAQVEHVLEQPGGSLADVADNLGHASLDTLRIYTHLALDRRRRRVRSL